MEDRYKKDQSASAQPTLQITRPCSKPPMLHWILVEKKVKEASGH
jgi:hypothetical protein